MQLDLQDRRDHRVNQVFKGQTGPLAQLETSDPLALLDLKVKKEPQALLEFLGPTDQLGRLDLLDLPVNREKLVHQERMDLLGQKGKLGPKALLTNLEVNTKRKKAAIQVIKLPFIPTIMNQKRSVLNVINRIPKGIVISPKNHGFIA